MFEEYEFLTGPFEINEMETASSRGYELFRCELLRESPCFDASDAGEHVWACIWRRPKWVGDGVAEWLGKNLELVPDNSIAVVNVVETFLMDESLGDKIPHDDIPAPMLLRIFQEIVSQVFTGVDGAGTFWHGLAFADDKTETAPK